jgi:DNA-binding HxlR family transcriptional regulator
MAERERSCEDPRQQAAWAAATSEALRVIEGKWKIVIIGQLWMARGPLRFSRLERLVEGVTQKMLIQQLRELERDGIVARTIFPQVPPRVEYALTETGFALGPALTALIDWADMRRRQTGAAEPAGACAEPATGPARDASAAAPSAA